MGLPRARTQGPDRGQPVHRRRAARALHRRHDHGRDTGVLRRRGGLPYPIYAASSRPLDLRDLCQPLGAHRQARRVHRHPGERGQPRPGAGARHLSFRPRRRHPVQTRRHHDLQLARRAGRLAGTHPPHPCVVAFQQGAHARHTPAKPLPRYLRPAPLALRGDAAARLGPRPLQPRFFPASRTPPAPAARARHRGGPDPVSPLWQSLGPRHSDARAGRALSALHRGAFLRPAKRLVVPRQRARLHPHQDRRRLGPAFPDRPGCRSLRAPALHPQRQAHLQPHPPVGHPREHPAPGRAAHARRGPALSRRLPQARRLRRGRVRGRLHRALGTPLARGNGAPLLVRHRGRHLREPR